MSTAVADPPASPAPPTTPAPPATPAPDPAAAAPTQPAAPATPAALPPEDDPFDLGDIARELVGEEAYPKKAPAAKPDAAGATPATPTPGTPAAVQPAPGTTAPAATPEKKVTVRKERPVEEVVETTMRKVLADQKPPETEKKPTETPPAPDPDEAYVKALGEDERAILETAAFAETKFPDKHKGLKKQWVDYYKKIDAYIEKERKEDPERTFDNDDKEFQDFIEENRPNVDGAAWRRLEHLRIKEEATQEALKAGDERWKKELDETKEKQHLLEVRPEIEKTLVQSQRELEEMLVSVADSPVAAVEKVIKEKGYEEAVKADPIFVPIVHTIKETTLGNVAEYFALVNGVKKYNPANPDPQHVWLLDFIRAQEKWFDENGGEAKVQRYNDGSMRAFVSRAEYTRIAKEKPAEIARYWTFQPEDIRRFIIANGKIDAENRVKAVSDQISAAGYSRVKANGAPPVAQQPNPPPTETGSPRATTSTAPGPATSTATPGNAAFAADELLRMGLPVPK